MVLNKIKIFIKCKILQNHTWTCKANENIKPTKEELKSYIGFKKYSEMYCKKCLTKSKLNNTL